LHVGKVGGENGDWLLKGNKCSSAGGFPSNPILSGSTPNSRVNVEAIFSKNRKCGVKMAKMVGAGAAENEHVV
jgi:hypothetical protein